MPTIKVLQGSNFVETVVNSSNVGDLRQEKDISGDASVSINGVDATNSTAVEDGNIVAWVSNNKTGGKNQ